MRKTHGCYRLMCFIAHSHEANMYFCPPCFWLTWCQLCKTSTTMFPNCLSCCFDLRVFLREFPSSETNIGLHMNEAQMPYLTQNDSELLKTIMGFSLPHATSFHKVSWTSGFQFSAILQRDRKAEHMTSLVAMINVFNWPNTFGEDKLFHWVSCKSG